MARLFSSKGLFFNYMICINVYAFTRYILQIVINYIFQDSHLGMEWAYIVNTIFYILLFLCGCLVGYLINKRTILHASFATAMAITLSNFYMGVGLTDYARILSLSVLGAILGGAGGGIVLLVRKFYQLLQKR